MRTSIALATFDGEEYLREQLESYAKQTLLPDQLVISDDCSTDSTVAIAREFALTAPFEILIVENEVNVGVTANFSQAMSLCTGDLIFLSDQDDVWVNHKVERVVQAAKCSDGLLIVHDLELVGPNLEASGRTMTSRLHQLGRTRRSHVKGCCTAIRRDLLGAALPVPDGLGHDNWLHDLAAELGRRTFLPEVLLLYRLHPTNTSRWTIRSERVNALTPVPVLSRPRLIVEALKRLAKPRARDELKGKLSRYRMAMGNAEARGIEAAALRRVVGQLELRSAAVANRSALQRGLAVGTAWWKGAYPRGWSIAVAARDILRP